MATQGVEGVAQALDFRRDSSEAIRQNGFFTAPRVSKGTNFSRLHKVQLTVAVHHGC